MYWRAYERECLRIFGDFVPDAIVEYDGYSEVWASIAAALGRRGSRAVCYQHNQMDLEFQEKYPNLMRLFRLYKDFDQIVAVSPLLAEHNRRELLSLGIDVGQRQVAARNLLDVQRVVNGAGEPISEEVAAFMSSHEISLVAVGRMSHEKNHLVLIEALSRVVKDGMDVGLILVGSGLLEPMLKSRIESLGLVDRTLFTGQISNPYPIIAAVDYLVLPSTHEGQPVTLLEAMTLDTPVIASDIPGNRDIVNLGYGYLCGVNVDDIVHAIHHVSDNSMTAGGSFDVELFNCTSYDDTMHAILGLPSTNASI